MVSIRKELAEYGLIPHKGLGQHFLIDRNILNKVIRTARIEKEDTVLEVGSGLGEMTLALARLAKRVIAVEIDSRLVEILRNKIQAYPNVEIIESDILKINFDQLIDPKSQLIKVVANLPYQISTPLLFRFVDSRENFLTLTLMLQKEVAERLVAPPGGKEYGPLSIFVQLVTVLSIKFFIKPSAFFPSPKVDSAVVHMEWRKRPMVELSDEEWFKKVVRACFNYRRKTLVNGLKHSGISFPHDMEQRIENIGIDPRRRPETLTIQEFANLADALKY
ncbi:MAG: 16S rRNA (adenine(1518)-N(6)/adenine(1519)-N(6))-dimethyltransferase RsmA [Thermodesulfobacteriota bacterium]|nr:16S rRNA (adenine(1518)-N(6)/adenine(1519)-N(6))-dimethyltransferase RsmA [Thermodesulfobacteriota bacterium]